MVACRNGFFSPIEETTCFTIRRDTLLELGGFHEGFRSPGGGIVNQDIFKVIIESPKVEPVMLLGEATFCELGKPGVGSLIYPPFLRPAVVGDVDGDGIDDLVVGNVGLDLRPLVDQHLVTVQNLIDDAVVGLNELVTSTVTDLLEVIEEIHDVAGRERDATNKWVARSLDIDLLLYGDLMLPERPLRVPRGEVIDYAFASGSDIGAAANLATYARWRTAEQRNVALATDGLARLFSNPLGLVRLGRNLGLVAMELLPGSKHPLARAAMGMLGRQPKLARGVPLG